MPAEDPQADQPLGSRDRHAESMIGRVVDDFEIRREIGRGGMGTVYEAWQRSLQRVVAVKVLATPVGMSPTAVERFQREAQAAGKLHHANIVSIYAQGESDGIYYYAMELVRGRSVHQIIEEARRKQRGSDPRVTETRVLDGIGQPLPDSASAGSKAAAGHGNGDATTVVEGFDTVARLTATVAEALEYAHQAGVIHRDVKPHNLILGDDGHLCISDFGLARVLEQPGMTVTGEFLGSPLYMSPEQVSGSQRVDHRTDTYSLGVTLYEWMTLCPPFPGQRRDQIINQILTADPAPLRSIDPRVPVDLETICLKAIERDPRQRYQTAGAMAADLRRYLERRSIKARRTGLVRRLGRLLYRRRVAALAVVLLAVVGLSATVVVKQRGRLADLEQTTPASPTDPQPSSGSDSSATAAGPKPIAFLPGLMDLANAPAPPGEAAQTPPADWSAFLAEGGQLSQRLRETPLFGGGGSQPRLSAQLDAFERYVAGELAAVLASMHADVVEDRRDQPVQPGSPDDLYFQAARADDETALSLLDRALQTAPDHYLARHLRAVVLCRMYRFADMSEEARRLVEAEPEQAKSHFMLGASLMLLGETERALQELDRTRQLERNTAWLHTLRGLCFARANLGLALAEYNQALAINPDDAVARFARGKAQAYLGGYEAALMDAEKLVELLPDSAEAFTFRGECYDRLGRYDDAFKDYDKALDLGGNSVSLAAKQLLAALSAQNRDLQLRASAETRDQPPTEVPPKPPPRFGDSDAVTPLDRLLRELTGGGPSTPGAKPKPDELPVP